MVIVMETYPGTSFSSTDISYENVLTILLKRQRTSAVALEIRTETTFLPPSR